MFLLYPDSNAPLSKYISPQRPIEWKMASLCHCIIIYCNLLTFLTHFLIHNHLLLRKLFGHGQRFSPGTQHSQTGTYLMMFCSTPLKRWHNICQMLHVGGCSHRRLVGQTHIFGSTLKPPLLSPCPPSTTTKQAQTPATLTLRTWNFYKVALFSNNSRTCVQIIRTYIN